MVEGGINKFFLAHSFNSTNVCQFSSLNLINKFSQEIFSHPYSVDFRFFISLKSFFLAFSPLSYFFAPCNSKIVRLRCWETAGRAKLNWLENCFQIQIFKFHLYLLAVVSEKAVEEKDGKKCYESLRVVLLSI